MSILHFITEGQESEPRVLKAQLTLAATAARNTRITSPVWALACAILCSTGLFGHVSFAHTVFLPLAAWLVQTQGWRSALVWLAVMMLFPLSLLLLKYNRGRLPRLPRTPLLVIFGTIAVSLVIFVGNIILDTLTAR